VTRVRLRAPGGATRRAGHLTADGRLEVDPRPAHRPAASLTRRRAARIHWPRRRKFLSTRNCSRSRCSPAPSAPR